MVKEGDRNEELRLSLRSLGNVPHGTVWVAGFKPRWVTNVEYLPTRQTRVKYVNSTQNLLTACAHPDLSDRFIFMNDDFFILRRMNEIPALHRGSASAVVEDYERRFGKRGTGLYRQGMAASVRLLHRWGIANPLSYELHVPMMMHKEGVIEVVKRAHADDRTIPALHKRTLYGNYFDVGGRRANDIKVTDTDRTWQPNQRFVSCGDQAFLNGAIGKRLRDKFPDPSPYEA